MPTYSRNNKRRHPNKSVGMGKLSKLNKRRAYVYSELKSTYQGQRKVKKSGGGAALIDLERLER